MKPAAELAQRIDHGNPSKEGRYDWASKVEVRAFVKRETDSFGLMVAGLNDEIVALQARVAELELSWWQRLKRVARKAADS